MSKKKKYIKPIIIAILCVIVTGSLCFYCYYNIAVKNAVKQDTILYIPTGATYDDVIDTLERNDMLYSMKSFERTASLLSYKERVKSGRYQLNKGASYRRVVEMLRRGDQKAVKVIFNNIRTLEQLAGKITANIEIDSISMLNTLKSDSIHKRYSLDSTTFISMFIPNTYEIYWNTPAEALVERLNREFNKFWNKERVSKLSDSGMSRTEVITLASIVYEESKMSDELSTVAGVYVNRLKIGMPLQADPTVKFAVQDFTLKRILNIHLSVDSPYNTYKYKGLPPGPICMPSIKAIDGVLDYEKHKYLYFCAAPDFSGYHKFAANLSQHNRNAREYHRKLNSLKIYK